MAKVYADFAEVYDELMDETPYAQWCENLTQLIARYGVSRPVERRGMQTCERSDADALASGLRYGHADTVALYQGVRHDRRRQRAGHVEHRHA